MINELDYTIGNIHLNPMKIEEKGRWTYWAKGMRYLLADIKHILTTYALGEK